MLTLCCEIALELALMHSLLIHKFHYTNPVSVNINIIYYVETECGKNIFKMEMK